MLVEVRFPRMPGWTARYEKFHRTAQAWAVVGVAAAVRRENGQIAEARVALTNMGRPPVRARAVEAAVAGAGDLGTVRSAASHAGEATSPPSDIRARPSTAATWRGAHRPGGGRSGRSVLRLVNPARWAV